MSDLNFGLKEEDLIFRKRIYGRAFVTDRIFNFTAKTLS